MVSKAAHSSSMQYPNVPGTLPPPNSTLAPVAKRSSFCALL